MRGSCQGSGRKVRGRDGNHVFCQVGREVDIQSAVVCKEVAKAKQLMTMTLFAGLRREFASRWFLVGRTRR